MLLERFVGEVRRRLGRDPQLAELCSVLARAERLALRCVEAQVRQCADDGLRRQLLVQRRHETAHAALFEAVLSGVELRIAPGFRPMDLLDAYEARVLRALEAGHFADSVVGLQIAFEGAAAWLFRAVQLEPCYAPLEPIRRILERQERAHQRFGHRALTVLRSHQCQAPLASAGQEYGERVADLLASCERLLGRFSVASDDYEWRAIPARE